MIRKKKCLIISGGEIIPTPSDCLTLFSSISHTKTHLSLVILAFFPSWTASVDRETETQRHRDKERQRYRETERQRDRDTDRQRHRETAIR